MQDTFIIEFNGRKPSHAQIMRALGKAIEQGHKDITVFWGENTIDIMQQADGNYYGYGWIKQISGSDIAEELNDIRAEAIQELKKARQFYNDHFQFIHIK